MISQPRLLLAVKTALAAAVAYWIAPQVPGVAAEYPYYAPLGAVIAMYPTIKSSLRQGVQVLVGVVTGIALASLVFALQDGRPGVLSVALLVGVGVVLAGIRWLGAGRDWVLTAGLFVLLLGGADAEAYSLGYIVQLGVGVVVGVVVNVVLVPPLNTSRADDRLRRVRHSLADRADEIAGVFETTWPIEDDDWERRVGVLPSTLRRVRDAVQYADESRHMNPRWLLKRRDLAGSTPSSRSSSASRSTSRTSPRSRGSSAGASAARSACPTSWRPTWPARCTPSPRSSAGTAPPRPPPPPTLRPPTPSSRPVAASPTSGTPSTRIATDPPPTPVAASRSPSRSAASWPPSTPTT
nr:hypothetical protein GCM10025699_50250 [Microbacterium flavescens]